MASISNQLLTSIVRLSTLQEEEEEGTGEAPAAKKQRTGESGETKSLKEQTEGHSLKDSTNAKPVLLDSPLKKGEGVKESVELRLGKLIAKLEKAGSASVEDTETAKLALLQMKQLEMALQFVRDDSSSKIERLELERDLLLKEIEFIRNRAASAAVPSGSTSVTAHGQVRLDAPATPKRRGDSAVSLQQVTPITTPQNRRIKIIETTRLSSQGPGHKRGHSDPGMARGTQFFHYYASKATRGDFNSVDNRRNKRKRDEEEEGEEKDVRAHVHAPVHAHAV